MVLSKSIVNGLLMLLIFSFSFTINAATFVDATEEAGLLTPLIGMRVHSVIWGDWNRDKYPDVFVGTMSDEKPSVYTYRGWTGSPNTDHFLYNINGKFVAIDGPFNNLGRSSSGAFIDFDRDGYLDFIDGNHSNKNYYNAAMSAVGNFLYKNGAMAFIDVTANSNLLFPAGSSGRNTFALDYDGDGLIDLYMQKDSLMNQLLDAGKGNRLMKNLGNFVFEDVTATSGLPIGLRGLGGAIGDVNADTWPDILNVGGTKNTIDMFINNKNGTFRRINVVDYNIDSSFSVPANAYRADAKLCGAFFGDLNNDGLIDFVVGHHYSNESRIPTSRRALKVFLNMGNDANGDPIFTNISDVVGVLKFSTSQMNCSIDDFDNDGKMDIWAGTMLGYGTTNLPLIYTNTGNDANGVPTFSVPTTDTTGNYYFSTSPACDYNLDGKLDILCGEWEPDVPSLLMKNTTVNANNYIRIGVSTLDPKVNINGIGATIKIYKPGQAEDPTALLGTKIITVADGYSCGQQALAHFGLGAYTSVDIVGQMPCDGPKYTLNNWPVNNIYWLPTGTDIKGANPSEMVASVNSIRLNASVSNLSKNVFFSVMLPASINTKNNFSIGIYSINGQLINKISSTNMKLTNKIYTGNWNSSGATKGIYLVKIECQKQVVSKKIILM